VTETPNTNVRAAIHYDNFYEAGIILGLSVNNLFIKSTRLNIIGDFSKYSQFRADYSFYFGARHNFYTRFSAMGGYSQLPVYEDDLLVGTAQDNYLRAGFTLNYILRTNNNLALGLHYRRVNIRPDDALKKIYPIFIFDKIGIHSSNLGFSYDHNTLNSTLYPKRGTWATLDFKYVFTGEEYLLFEPTDSNQIGDTYFDAEPFWKLSGGHPV
jgi:hypothetical protein